ncbi:MAG: GyrI-like domain-containing protein [Clostridiales bacterium]|jgi:hypothetical protein|nr:GyrI-like domain-containing protein [Clostridiales bacterium]
MELRIVKIEDDILIGGFSVESTGEEKDNNEKRGVLFNGFINNGQKELLNGIAKNNNEYYIVTWLTAPTIKYLLGQKVIEKTEGLEFKAIKKGEYATKKIPPKHDSYNAWMELYTKDIAEAGYRPLEQSEGDIAFEFYPNGLDGEYELCVLVVKE